MNTDRFSKLAIEGASNYYDYLKAKGRGCEEISVDRVRKEDAIYLLCMGANSFSADAVVIKVKNREFSRRELEITEHDRDNRVLYVRVANEIADPLINVDPRDVRVISDLKFLSERVRIWYENNSNHLHSSCPMSNLPVAEMIQPALSVGQMQAVYNAFSHPQTYGRGMPLCSHDG